ncbi:MAG: hypothetical protein JSW61_13470 [Candidatus Thorarchaeota archaeon]|nr:MAG: hypothetical protein JSW61_13470 [Candidatus Thorarchaeota archaeon]
MTTTQEIIPYKREITSQERRFLFSPASFISLVLRFRGHVTREAMEKAVEKLLVTYPLFGVRVEWNEERVKWSTTEGAAKVPVKVHPRVSDNSWMSVLNHEFAIPMRPSVGPLTRFVLVMGSDVSELIAMSHHMISDGRSLQFALREILLHLKDPGREPPVVREAPSHTPEIFPEGLAMGRFRSTMIGRINKKWAKERILFDEEDLLNIWEATWKNTHYVYEVMEFDEIETNSLVQVSRANDVTLNSTILVAILRARIEAVGSYDRKARVATAVDTRKRLRVDCSDAVGFYAGGSSVQLDYKENATFWENVRVYHKIVTKDLDENNVFGTVSDHFVLDQTLLDAMVISSIGDQIEPHQSRHEKLTEYSGRKESLAAKFIARMASNTPDIMSTNLGRIELPNDVPGIRVERAFFAPTSGMGFDIVLGVITVGGRLTITFNHLHGYVDGENMRKIRNKAEEILRGLIHS